jgi:transposase InsO family protein
MAYASKWSKCQNGQNVKWRASTKSVGSDIDRSVGAGFKPAPTVLLKRPTLLEEFAYLAVVLDAFSRRVVGWALETYLEARLATAALTIPRRVAPQRWLRLVMGHCLLVRFTPRPPPA